MPSESEEMFEKWKKMSLSTSNKVRKKNLVVLAPLGRLKMGKGPRIMEI